MGNPEADVDNEVLKTEQELQVILVPYSPCAVSDLQHHVTSFLFFSFLLKLRLAEDLVVMLPSCQHWLLITSNTEVCYTMLPSCQHRSTIFYHIRILKLLICVP